MTTSSQPQAGEHERRRPRMLLAIVAGSLAIGACASSAPKNESLPRNSVDIVGRAASPTRDAGALVLADALVSADDRTTVEIATDASVHSDANVAPHPRGRKNPLGFSTGERLPQRKDAYGDASASEAGFLRQILAAKQHNQWAGVMRSLKNGANPNVNILNGWPLIAVIAAYEPHSQPSVMGIPATRESPGQVAYRFQILRFLVNNGVNIEQPGFMGQTPLMAASDNGQLQWVRFLLNEGALTSSTDEIGRNVVFYPTGQFHIAKLKILKLLVAAGADVNHRAKGGGTALMDAAFRDDKLMVKRLLLLGADISLVDEKGSTALDIATQLGRRDMASYLEKVSR